MFPQSLKADLVIRTKTNLLKTVKTFTFYSVVISFILPMLLVMPLISCQSSQKKLAVPDENANPSKILMIPRWYAELPNVDSCRIGYGYSGIYLDAALQKEALLKNGAENMAKNDEVFIEAGWAGSQTHSKGLNASYVMEKGWKDRASVLEKNLKFVREYRMGNGIIALCAFCPDESLFQGLVNQIDDSLVNINADEPPEWVKEPISHPGYIYGIGTASGRIKPGNAWEEAERQARADLAFNLAAHHNILLKTISESTSSMSQKLSETRVEVALKDVIIIRHGYSHANKSFYALAQMPTPAGRVNTGN